MGYFSGLVIEVCSLYEQGMDAVRIARLLDMPVTDVGYIIETYYDELVNGSN